MIPHLFRGHAAAAWLIGQLLKRHVVRIAKQSQRHSANPYGKLARKQRRDLDELIQSIQANRWAMYETDEEDG